VPLQSSPCGELHATKCTVVGICLHMVAFDVATGLTLVAKALVTESTDPELHARPICLAHCLFFNVSQHFVLLHKD